MGHLDTRVSYPPGATLPRRRRNELRLGFISVALLVLLVLPGCGQIRGRVTTTLHPDMTLSRTTDLYLTGLLAMSWSQLAGDGTMTLPGGVDGRDVITSWEGDELHLSHSIEHASLEELASGPGAGEISVSKRYVLVATLYEYKQRISRNSFTGAPQGQLPGVAMEFAVAMPGRIIGSTAERTDDSVAVWSFTSDSAWSDLSMEARSVALNLYETIGVAVLILIVLILPSRRKARPKRARLQ